MSAQTCGKIDGESVKRAVAFIERRHPVKTGASFEAETGISAETFRKWRDGASMPGWRHSLKMILVFGPEFLAATVENAPAWLNDAYRAEMARKLTAEIAERQRELSELTRF
jgi:hypothetical protein